MGSGVVKADILFNLLDCMSINLSDMDRLTIKRNCMNQVGGIRYMQALKLLQIKSKQSPSKVYGSS